MVPEEAIRREKKSAGGTRTTQENPISESSEVTVPGTYYTYGTQVSNESKTRHFTSQ